jgi:hypothetical protein
MGDEERYAEMLETLIGKSGAANTFEKMYEALTDTLNVLQGDPKIPDLRLTMRSAEVLAKRVKEEPRSFDPGYAEKMIRNMLNTLETDLYRLSNGEDVPLYAKRKKAQETADAEEKKAPGAGDGSGRRRKSRKSRKSKKRRGLTRRR